MIRYETRPDPVATMQAHPRRCSKSIEDKLADHILEMGHNGEVMTFEALRLRGYTADVLRRVGDAALAKARRRSIRHIDA